MQQKAYLLVFAACFIASCSARVPTRYCHLVLSMPLRWKHRPKIKSFKCLMCPYWRQGNICLQANGMAKWSRREKFSCAVLQWRIPGPKLTREQRCLWDLPLGFGEMGQISDTLNDDKWYSYLGTIPNPLDTKLLLQCRNGNLWTYALLNVLPHFHVCRPGI